MPLWSNEEWRAHIGSSWCALSRPYKTDKSSGSYRSYALSGRAMLQAVYVLMTLILVQGLAVKSNCRKLVKLNNFHLRGVLMILILLLQAKAFVQSSLLLRCGDIESNPGPGIHPDLDYDDVDGSTVLTEDDFREVYREVVNIQCNYYQFGIELGLPLREMDAIQKAFRQDIAEAFREVLKIWLRQRYRIEKYGPPMWRRLVEAVDSPTGGNNHALAKKIAQEHPVKVADNSTAVGKNDHVLIAKCHPPASDHKENPVIETSDMQSPNDPQALVQRCRDTMVAYYLKQVDDRAWPPVKSTNFVNLALIKDQTSWRKTIQKSVDDIVGDKTRVSYQNITDEHCIGTFTLLEGRPGSGKTVLMNKISCDWAKGEIFKSNLLIFIPLRRLGAEPDRKLATLLRVACPALPQSDIEEMVSYIKHTQGEGVVFLFDGFDEYVPRHYNIITDHKEISIYLRKIEWYIFRPQDQYVCEQKAEQKKIEDIFEILHGNNLTKSTIFVTSRPAACNNIRRYARKRIEVLGFLKPQIIEYVHHYFATNECKVQQLVAHLKRHPNLMNMAYLPLHCAMLAFLYEDNTFLPETETEFYKHFTLSTLLRSICREHGSVTTITSFNQLPHRENITFNKVCKLAFNATVNSKQVFTFDDIKCILTTHARDDVNDLGLIVIDRYFMRYGLDNTYTFLHLTFQEYLAAVYIAGLKKYECKSIIQKYKDKENLSVVWKFLCGMMDFSRADTMDTFESIMKGTKDKVANFQCCFETQHSSPCNCFINYFNGRLTFDSNNFTPSDCAAIGYTINKSDIPYENLEIHLSFNNCSFSSEGALNLLQNIGNRPLSLTLSNCASTSITDFLDNLRRCPLPGLQNLNLEGNDIGDTEVQALAEGLKYCANMKKLNLSRNNIGDTGVHTLVKNLEHCTDMNEINLVANLLSDDAVPHLIEAILTFKNLRRLSLQSNCFSGSGVSRMNSIIKQRSKKIKIELCATIQWRC